ncbi:UNVERIFIED_CONTAM: hypothetical protein H355_016412, partial [Colinus virginianus]
SAWLLPEERKSGLLHACLGSVLLLPHHKNLEHQDAALYNKLQRIVKVIHISLPAIKSKRALKSLDRALFTMASQQLKEMVRSMLVSSPTWASRGRVMSELPGALRGFIFRHLIELLNPSSCCQDIEMLECMDLEEELWSDMKLVHTCLQSQSRAMQQLVLRGILQLSKRQDTAETVINFLTWIVEQDLQDTESNICATVLLILGNLLRLPEGKELSFFSLELMDKLPALFNDESSTVRQLSIHLCLLLLPLGSGARGLCCCLGCGGISAVWQASWKALLGAAQFLCWRQLEHLVQTAQFWQIGKCMVCTFPCPRTGSGLPRTDPTDPVPFPGQLARRRKNAAQDHLGQSLLYLQSPQEPLWQEAVRFIGEPPD